MNTLTIKKAGKAIGGSPLFHILDGKKIVASVRYIDLRPSAPYHFSRFYGPAFQTHEELWFTTLEAAHKHAEEVC